MKKINNLKIRTKLIILIVFMVLGMMIIGVVGIIDNRKSNKLLDDIYTKNVTSIIDLSDIEADSKANFINILNLIISSDENEKTKIWADYQKHAKIINKNSQDFYNSLPKGGQEEYKIINDKLAECDKISNQMIGFIASEQHERAIELFSSSGKAKFEDLQTSISKFRESYKSDAEKIYKESSLLGRQTTTQLFVIFVVISVISIVFGIIIIRTITNPIMKVLSLIKKTSSLDLGYDNSYDAILTHTDEVGVIAKSVEELRVVLRNLVGNVSSISNNLTISSEELASSTKENTKTINQIVNAINEIAQGNNVQADMVAKTNESIVTMVSNIDEVNKSTATNATNATESINMIEEGQNAINLTVEKMIENKKKAAAVGISINELSSQMDKVGNIISVIKDISSQTNLLALNASIEAARAGESGRGFAVVAAEIGNLAQDTASAVNEITGIITDAVSKNTATSENMDKVQEIVMEQEKAIDITKEAFDKIKESVDEIASRTMTISERIQDINESANDISNKAQDMSAVAQESAASSEEISASNEEQLASIEMIASSAHELSNMASDLNNEISKFKL